MSSVTLRPRPTICILDDPDSSVADFWWLVYGAIATVVHFLPNRALATGVAREVPLLQLPMGYRNLARGRRFITTSPGTGIRLPPDTNRSTGTFLAILPENPGLDVVPWARLHRENS